MKSRVLIFQLRTILILGLALIGLLALPAACSRSQTPVQIKIAVVGDDVEEWRPVSVSVQSGGTVTWFNNGNELHSVISSEHLWSDRRLAHGESFNFTFAKSGTFTYRDQSDTFTGTITVH